MSDEWKEPDSVDAQLLRTDRLFDRIDKRLDKLEVGQEEIKAQIRRVAEGHAATQAAIDRAKDAIIAHIDERIAPLEQAVRARLI